MRKDPSFYGGAQTPPMGWNSWDCFGPTVTEDEVKANADSGKTPEATWLGICGCGYPVVC